VAAEIATVAPQLCNKLVLVGAMGLKPERAEIFDYFLEGGLTGLRRAFHRPEQSSEFTPYCGKPALLAFASGDLTNHHRQSWWLRLSSPTARGSMAKMGLECQRIDESCQSYRFPLKSGIGTSRPVGLTG
jgi:hypothetical protein